MRICSRRFFARALIVGFHLLLLTGGITSAATAQTVTATTGAVNGIVTDSTEAVVPGVTVTLSGPSLMAPRIALTDQQGGYRFSAVPTGEHTLTFELTGFGTIVREGVHVGLGFTATINAEISPGSVSDTVTVSGSPVVDLASTEVTTHFDSEKLASLPGSRDFFAVVANTPGVALSKMDVGGNGALSLQEYTAYGLRATTGVNRNEGAESTLMWLIAAERIRLMRGRKPKALPQVGPRQAAFAAVAPTSKSTPSPSAAASSTAAKPASPMAAAPLVPS